MSKGLRGPGTRRDEALAALAHGGGPPDETGPSDAAPPRAATPPDPAGTPDQPASSEDPPPPGPGAGSPGDSDAAGPVGHPMLGGDVAVPVPAGRGRRAAGVSHEPIRQVRSTRRRIVVRTQPVLTAGERSGKRPRPPREGRHPGVGMPLLVVLGLLALFVSWVSAEPFWLAVGHHDAGTVEVTRCTGQGDLDTRCVGTFSAQSREYAVDLTTVSGAATADRRVGRSMPARMVSEQGRIAYVGDTAGLHVRWSVGLALLLVIGFGIAAATGAWRFRGASRPAAVATSLLAPFLLAGTMLALMY